ncbi:hypothetical protein HU200_039653 [Digitaria exilis]|uniref:Pectinesterase inhibitor domain-containing protein n=1 Tax=Digitaria exilis TaxID=1010633 RepID=A0A835B9Z0_9POAL|nr:hypothetical protein HU200_039653 [Digitaria exilis]
MERFVIASLLLGLLASAAAVEGRVVPSVFEDDRPSKRSGDRVLIGVDLFHQACDLVHFKTMCQSLTKLPGVTTPRQVLLASMRVAAAKAMEAKARVDEYAARTPVTGPMVSIVDGCRKGYDDVATSLEETRKRIEAQGTQMVDLNNQVSGALTHTDDCQNGFDDFEMASPFAAVQKNVFRLVDNVLNIAVEVQKAEAKQNPHVH